jgi:hypothetical protein
VENDKERDASSHPLTPLQVPAGLVLSDSEMAETLADSLQAQFQPVNDPSEPAMRAYRCAP